MLRKLFPTRFLLRDLCNKPFVMNITRTLPLKLISSSKSFKYDHDFNFHDVSLNEKFKPIQTPTEKTDEKDKDLVIDSQSFEIIETMPLDEIIKRVEYIIKKRDLKDSEWKKLFVIFEIKKNDIKSTNDITQIICLIAKSNKDESKGYYEKMNFKSMIASNLNNLTPREFCLILWALTKIKVNDQEFFKGFIKIINSKPKIITYDDYLNLINGLINLNIYEIQTFREIFKISKKQLVSLLESTQNYKFLLNVTWCLASLEDDDKVVWEKILTALNSQIQSLNILELTQFLTALTKLETSVFQQYINWEKITASLKNHASEMDLNELNNTIKILNKLEYKFNEELKNIFQEKITFFFQSNFKVLSKIPLSQLCGCLISTSLLKFDDGKLFFKIVKLINNKILEVEKNDLIPLLKCLPLISSNQKKQMIFSQIELFIKNNINDLDSSTVLYFLKNYPLKRMKELENILMGFILKRIELFTLNEHIFLFSGLSKVKKSLKPQDIDNILSVLLPKRNQMDLLNFSIVVKDFAKLNYHSKNGDELIIYATKLANSLIDENVENIIEKENEISLILLGSSQYNYKSNEFWKKIELILFKNFYKFSLNNQVILAEVAITQFSDAFLAYIQEITKKNLKTYTTDHMIEILKKMEKIKVSALDKNFWGAVEKEIKERLEKDQINLHELSALLMTMKSHKAGSFKFWSDIFTIIINKKHIDKLNLQIIKSRSCLIEILETCRKNQKISHNFGSYLLPYVLNMTTQDFLLGNEIYEITLSYSRLKIVDDQLWYNLEGHFLKIYKTMSFYMLMDSVIAIGNVKRGSREFWKAINSYLIENHTKIQDHHLYFLLRVIEENFSFEYGFWVEVYYNRINKASSEDLVKFVNYLEDIKKNGALLNGLKKFDCFKFFKIWDDKFRFNFLDEEKRKSVDQTLMELTKELEKKT